MVNNLRLVPQTSPPKPLPANQLGRRVNGPIYDLATVLMLVRDSDDHIQIVTDTCRKSLDSLEWDVDDVAKLMTHLTRHDYQCSEWCQASNNFTIDADVYRIRYDHIDECRGNYSHAEYYLKFGFLNNDPHLIICLFSCHLPREKA